MRRIKFGIWRTNTPNDRSIESTSVFRKWTMMTTGLSFEDCAHLLRVLQRLVDTGNSVVLIEHHLDLIKSSDWLIDLGPGAGDKGGELIAEGTPEDVARMAHSQTGQYMARLLGAEAEATVSAAD